MSEILCRRCGKPLGEHDRGRCYAHVCEECCAKYRLCPDCGNPVELTHEQVKMGFACSGYHTGEDRAIPYFGGIFGTRKVTCPKCGFEFEV